MFFKLSPNAGSPLYLQLIEQIRHAVESGALEDGDQLPGIRTLAEQLVVSPNTVAKAYSQLEHEGILDLRHGSGAFARVKRGKRSMAISRARQRFARLIVDLRGDGFRDDELRRIFEAALLQSMEVHATR